MTHFLWEMSYPKIIIYNIKIEKEIICFIVLNCRCRESNVSEDKILARGRPVWQKMFTQCLFCENKMIFCTGCYHLCQWTKCNDCPLLIIWIFSAFFSKFPIYARDYYFKAVSLLSVYPQWSFIPLNVCCDCIFGKNSPSCMRKLSLCKGGTKGGESF